MLHLDLHPLNVIIGSACPVVIDWTSAASGDPALDIGIASLLIGPAISRPPPGSGRSRLTRAIPC